MNRPVRLIRRWWAPFCALGLLVLVVMIPRHDRPRRLRVAPGLWPGSETMVLAHSTRELSADEFQMIELPWSSAVMRALGNGAADVVVVTLDAVLRMREGGQDLRVIMVLDESTGADVVLAKKGITSMKELRGMRVGVSVRGTGAYLLACALHSEGMSMGDVRIVQLNLSEMEDAVVADAVDAVVVSEPWTCTLKHSGLVPVFDSKSLSVPIVRVLVASKEACDRLRAKLVTLMEAHLRWIRVLRSGAAFPGRDLVLRRARQDLEEFTDAMDLWRPVSWDNNLKLLIGDNPELEAWSTSMTDIMLRSGLLKYRPANQDWIEPSLIKEARP